MGGLLYPGLSLILTSESLTSLDRFCHINQQGRELALGMVGEQIGQDPHQLFASAIGMLEVSPPRIDLHLDIKVWP